MEEGLRKPSWFLHLTEIVRAIFETIKGYLYIEKISRRTMNNGKVIVVIPGLLSTDLSTTLMRKLLRKIGYIVYGWDMGRNLGRIAMLPLVSDRITQISNTHNQKITLIGWSMGGIFAREVAKLNPESVEKVITIGSPFANVHAPNHAKWIFDLLNDTKDLIPEVVDQLAVPPTQNTIAFYSKKDGIVPWGACMDSPETDLHRNIEVSSSHFGMGANPQVLGPLLKVL